jgi:hypothetical protein
VPDVERGLGTAPRQARPIMVDELRAMIETLPDDFRWLRSAV